VESAGEPEVALEISACVPAQLEHLGLCDSLNSHKIEILPPEC
jgi:hypothetical protein